MDLLNTLIYSYTHISTYLQLPTRTLLDMAEYYILVPASRIRLNVNLFHELNVCICLTYMLCLSIKVMLYARYDNVTHILSLYYGTGILVFQINTMLSDHFVLFVT